MDEFLEALAEELSKPVNPAARPLALGRIMFDNNGDLYVIVGYLNEALRLCRLPVGMLSEDLGRRFRHAPTPDDPAAYELI